MVNDTSLMVNVTFPVISQSFLRPRYPYGRCFNLGPGIRMRNNKFDVIEMTIKPEKNENEKEYAQVYFQDPINGAQILPKDFEMKGDPLKIPIKAENLFKKFKIKISKYQHVEADPDFDCQPYTVDYTYTDCIEKEIASKYHELIGCHPPLISEKRDKMCNKTFDLDLQDGRVRNISLLLQDIVNDFESSTCKIPCTYFSYETSLLYSFFMEGFENDVKLVFDKTVYLTKTSFLLGIPSMLTGLGGAVFGGRTLLWFITAALGLIKIADKFEYFNFVSRVTSK